MPETARKMSRNKGGKVNLNQTRRKRCSSEKVMKQLAIMKRQKVQTTTKSLTTTMSISKILVRRKQRTRISILIIQKKKTARRVQRRNSSFTSEETEVELSKSPKNVIFASNKLFIF